ncbi:MAG: bifunctional diaminohydroxyphosphoribosylaminopyrimidine deaminase/5-amino-6-(5-phosphoribosylamino)uracil reductase RibD, partial [Bacteroidota bacterium]|nr:bifunctional diaminohydroxyphosphoribosylaminopyrimidine deaminase/5-amino-6-(5-phosphoribosylamino)uracil reductase RibD [Bacteroidota bacterium]
MTIDEIFMHRCLDLARLGAGVTAPNPMVGSVIVHEGKIIGEGFHQRFGEAHAEVNAINSVKDEDLLQKSTLYVNLEPCAHYGKTPPCAKLIIEKKIPRVIIGTVDPFAKVSGRGIQMLREAGIDVTVGVLSEECNQLNRRFFTFYQKKRPYIILKWAQTLDGYIDILREPESYGHPVWITNYLSKVSVHRLRTEETAIMIGTNTAEKDNPSLTAREWTGDSPMRIVLDRDLRLRNTLKIFDDSVHTLVFTKRYLTGKKNLEYVHIDY